LQAYITQFQVISSSKSYCTAPFGSKTSLTQTGDYLLQLIGYSNRDNQKPAATDNHPSVNLKPRCRINLSPGNSVQ